MSSGAGEMPRMSNGACSVANQTPQLDRPLNPKLRRMMETAAMIAPVQSIEQCRLRRDRLELEAQQQVDRAEDDHETERVAPADGGGERAGDQQREHAGRRDRRGEQPDRLGLLGVRGSSWR